MPDFIENQAFKGVDFSKEGLEHKEYIRCRFVGCQFPAVDFSGITFDGCRFENCDLSLAKIRDTAMRDIEFVGCKLLGLRFDRCNPYGLVFSFSGCVLDFASFFRLKIKKTRFTGCRMREVDLGGADLGESLFEECDLSGALFDATNLEKADFRTAHHYVIDPETCRVKKAKFSLIGLPGLLARYGIEIE